MGRFGSFAGVVAVLIAAVHAMASGGCSHSSGSPADSADLPGRGTSDQPPGSSASDGGPIDGGSSGAPVPTTRPTNLTCLALADGTAPAAPALSKTGCVDATAPTKPSAGMIAYDVNAPLWSDGASKRRWLALPEGKTIHVDGDGDFQLPEGAVLMKEFSLSGQRVETRLLMHRTDGSWGGYSYKWNADETDAVLVDAAGETTTAPQRWTFPSQSACMTCHTLWAGFSLGLEVGQLNRDVDDGAGHTTNQLDALDKIGIFDAPLGGASKLVSYARPDDPVQSLEERSRSVLHANCSGCHRPGGVLGGKPDFRYATSLSDAAYCGAAPALGTAGGPSGSKLLLPGAPGKSVISLRMHATAAGQMPPLGRSTVDTAGVTVLDQWISSLQACPTPGPTPLDCGSDWPTLGTFSCDADHRQHQVICTCRPSGYDNPALWTPVGGGCYSHVTGNPC